MKYLKQFFRFFLKFYKNRKYKKLNKKLLKASNKKVNERLVLRFEITKYIRKFAKLDKNNKSQYIPLDFATKQLVRFNVDKEFGQKMSKLNVKLNNKLQVV
ncbi:hypothetical protein [Tenacibaculum soleae]|uniref:hypothetical protein n=1 Tax=Tenacibaculum soleae TaxID=447689 RepID=UPI002300308F|nr:hypothetical protein [Tenacibaculum soleae]